MLSNVSIKHRNNAPDNNYSAALVNYHDIISIYMIRNYGTIVTYIYNNYNACVNLLQVDLM